MKITKLQIENLYGIEQLELDGKSVELVGTNGAGKSSVLDAIRLALTNNSKRKYIVKNGENEGRVLVKLDDGTTIDRKKRTDKSDYKSIKDNNGNEINSPESFLKDIFTPLQLEPVEFLSMNEQQQNRILLNLIAFDKDKKEFIKEKFGEEINWVDYNDSILEILNRIQAKDGLYYLKREEVNREIRNGLAIINDIAKDIPEGYDVEKWRKYNLSEEYERLNKIKEINNKIERAIAFKDDYNNKISQLDDKQTAMISKINEERNNEKHNLENKISELKNQISLLEIELANKDSIYNLKEQEIKRNITLEKSQLDENVKIAENWADNPIVSTENIENDLKYAEEMKGHINEYDRMSEMQNKVDGFRQFSQSLTDKIELARELPGIILKECDIPVKNLTVENGIPLVNGLPVGNLSEGEKLQLCVDVTLGDKNNLKLILIDGTEKLSEENRSKLYEICKEKELQVIATRTTDNSELTIIEL